MNLHLLDTDQASWTTDTYFPTILEAGSPRTRAQTLHVFSWFADGCDPSCPSGIHRLFLLAKVFFFFPAGSSFNVGLSRQFLPFLKCPLTTGNIKHHHSCVRKYCPTSLPCNFCPFVIYLKQTPFYAFTGMELTYVCSEWVSPNFLEICTNFPQEFSYILYQYLSRTDCF